MNTSLYYIFLGSFFLSNLEFCFSQTKHDLRKSLHQFEGLEFEMKTSKFADEFKELAADQKEITKRHLIELVNDSLVPNHGEIPTNAIAVSLIKIGDDQAILDAYAENLEEMDESNMLAAVDALCSTDSISAFKTVDKTARRWMGKISESTSFDLTSEQKRELNKTVVPFFALTEKMALSGSPIGEKMANAIRAEIKQKAENSQVWNKILESLDAEISKKNLSRPTKTRSDKRSEILSQITPVPISVRDSKKSNDLKSWSIYTIILCVLLGGTYYILRHKELKR